jgi:hypothetical protein
MRKTILCRTLFIILIAFALQVLTGCFNSLRTAGTLKIAGKVFDENTKKGIPLKHVIIQGLVRSRNNNKLEPVEAGQFSTDSSGCFSYSLKKIKGVKNYNFCFVGDSDYLFTTREMTLFDLHSNPKFLWFSLSRLADITIQIMRNSKIPVGDTLSLSWESDGVYFWFLSPYSVNNFGKTEGSFAPASGMGLTWIGRNVNSTVITKVFADKKTKISWELYRNGKRQVFIDTITCKRDFANTVNFMY